MDINAEYFKIFKKLVDENCPQIRTPQYTTEYYLEHIIYVLKDVVSWKSLSILHKNCSKYHYKTIQDKFIQWSRLGLFEKTFNVLLKKHTLKNIKASTTLNLFIDTTNINNLNGSELATYGQNKKKKICKISAICDADKNVYGITAHTGSASDVKTVNESINNVTKNIESYRRINLCGDKGYAMKKEDRDTLLEDKIKMVVPARKNQKKRTTAWEKKVLKKRYNIEHVFQSLKKYNRISIRRDRTMNSFMSFIYVALLINFPK